MALTAHNWLDLDQDPFHMDLLPSHVFLCSRPFAHAMPVPRCCHGSFYAANDTQTGARYVGKFGKKCACCNENMET
jgi:hypothetical protein